MLLLVWGRSEYGMTPGAFPALKATQFALLVDERGAKLTESFAIWLGASVCGPILATP
jgi:cobalamin-dependent methionine synthase I